jgi:RNA polymerase sigma-70 factor, ECF subfamily
MSKIESNDEFLMRLLGCQRGLYTYIFKLVANAADAQDILQETNVVLLRKQDEFPQIKSFNAWAAHIAYVQVLAHRSQLKRKRFCQNEQLLEQLAQEGEELLQDTDPKIDALVQCIELLTPEDRELIENRYLRDMPARKIAPQTGRSPGAIAQSLYRIRLILMRCIDKRLSTQG